MVKKFFIDDNLKKFRRRTAVILPKDIGVIIAISALSKNDEVVEIGGGSGYASYYLARIAKKVYIYEKKFEMYEDLKYNLKDFDNVEIFNKDGIEANHKAYLYLIDSPDYINIINNVNKYILRWIFLYLPNLTQAREAYLLLKELGFNSYIIRSILEEWEVDYNILKPKHKQLYHTAFIVLGERGYKI